MSQPLPLLADVPQLSSASRQQFQQYLARFPSTSARGSTSIDAYTSNSDSLLQRSANLAARVDSLHAQISGRDASSADAGDNDDDPQLFWTTLTLLTNLREVFALLQRETTDGGKARDAALARTQQNIGIVESLLRRLSVSSSGESDRAFTAAVRTVSSTSTSTTIVQDTPAENSYEYWRQRTLSAIDVDDTSSSIGDSNDDDAASTADSILTDPETHLADHKTKLAGITKDEDQDYSEYDRVRPSSSTSAHSDPHSKPTTTSTTSAAPTSASETILQSDRATHEALSSELLRMASVLKSNSLAFADALERDRLLLEKAGTDLGQNLDLMTRTRGRLGVYSKKARSMGWFTLSAIVVVIVSWMLMFLLIRLT